MSNSRIARNTLYMYVRLFATILIGLYTYRIVLNILGVSDYGLYSVVGGLIAMFSFISGSLEGATTRFLNIELGKSGGDLNRSFNINRILHLSLALIILILSETIGLWYVLNKLNVAPDKLSDALYVYHISVITSCVAIINTPFSGLYNAHEKFGYIASLDILNAIIRLGLIFLLQYYQGNALRLYAIIMCITTVSTTIVLRYHAIREWGYITHFRLVKGWKNYKEVLVFSNWNLLGTIALVARSSGSDLIINSFFGTIINGAFAISKTLNNYITTFSVANQAAMLYNLDG